MRSALVFIIASTVLMLVLATGNEVNAYPDPCLWLNHRHRHTEKTTTTAKPSAESLEDTSKETKKKTFRKLEKLIGDWLFSEPLQEKTTTTTTTPAPAQKNNNPIDEFLSNYISYLFSF